MASSFHIPDCLTREGRMILYKRFREPKLFRYAKNLEWEKISKRCQKRPRAAAREAKFQHEYAPNETPLHVVLHPFFLLGADVEKTVERSDVQFMVEERHDAAAALLDANKDAADVCCCLGTCPLTLVAMDPYGTIEDLDMLISASPKSALVQDLEKRTPLHYACINNRSNAPMIEKLLVACPEAAGMEERLGRLPLHYACMASVACSSNSTSFSTIAHSFAAMLTKEIRNSPLCTISVLRLLLSANEKATSAVDKEGKTPLHHLCLYIQAFNNYEQVLTTPDLVALLCLLVQTNPEVALLSDKDDFKPISVICEMYQQSDELLNSNPEIIGRTDQTPEKIQQQHAALKKVVSLVDEVSNR